MGIFMRFKSWAGAAGIAIALCAGGAGLEADVIDDPYLWLEDTHGEKALQWVNEQNAVSLRQLKSASQYPENYNAILAILDATDRIPTGQLHGTFVFNFWQDDAHVRGV